VNINFLNNPDDDKNFIYPVTFKQAEIWLDDFLENRFEQYAEERNDPNKNALSNLSPYLHFGQISAQRIA